VKIAPSFVFGEGLCVAAVIYLADEFCAERHSCIMRNATAFALIYIPEVLAREKPVVSSSARPLLYVQVPVANEPAHCFATLRISVGSVIQRNNPRSRCNRSLG
jgi:hypothetical protein